jgi:hypothetical protein
VLKYFAVAALTACFSFPGYSQDLSGFKKVLLPVYTSQPISGSNGSTFSTRLTGYAETDIRYFGRVTTAGEAAGVFTQEAFVPMSGYEALNYGPPRATGRFLFVQQDRYRDVALQYTLRSSDADKQTSDQVTTLPVVSTPLTGRSWILNVPISPLLTQDLWPTLLGYGFRNMLRIYDFDGDGSGEVDVRLFHEAFFGRTQEMESRRVKLDRRDGDDATFPFYAEVPIENRCIPFSVHTPCLAFTFRVEIDPVAPNAQYWAFVSTTDNRTQHVTIREPQPRRN